MRFELSGSLIVPDPIIWTFAFDGEFNPLDRIAEGYTNFDVICIGGGGGAGGGIDTANFEFSPTLVNSFGGAGGGGGIHRVKGLLSTLPSPCPWVAGAAGVVGTSHSSDPAFTTDGGNGGYSTFNGTTCRASGGVGGKRVQANSLTVTTQAHGGAGGKGGQTTVGGGGVGGTAGTPTATGPGTPGTNGADGTWDGTIGTGGGGGAGGVAQYGSGGTTCNAATNGGRGAYSASDVSVYAPGGSVSDDPNTGANNVVPGQGGGAKGAILDGLYTPYGSGGIVGNGTVGVVIIRLTAE